MTPGALRVLLGSAVLFFCTLLAPRVQAALTTSEKAQIRDFVAAGRLENVDRVRSLVARTDLTTEESVGALVDAVSPAPYTPERGLFLKQIVFGGASGPARAVLVQATVKALLARAESVYQRYVGGLDHEPRAISELLAIYAFMDATIANAGSPTATAHDSNAGISPAAYEDASKAVRDQIDRNSLWLKGDGAVAESIGRLRAQVHVLLFDMLPDGTTRRVDAADRVGIKGARRQMLVDWGILFADAGKMDDATVERVRQVLAKLPGARVDLAVLYAGEDRGPLRARGIVSFIGAPGADAYPFSDEVTPGTHDAPTSAITLDLAVLAAKRALDSRSELRLQAERDAGAAQGDAGTLLGRPRAPGIEHVMGAAIQLLLVDSQRAVDLAMVRWVAGRPESAAILSDAIGALAAFAPTPEGDAKSGQGPKIDLGKSTLSAIRLAPNGSALGFTLDGHAWSMDRAAPSFALTAVRRDTQVVTLAHLATARPPMKEGSSWTAFGYTFNKLRGTPRVGLSPAGDKGGPGVKLVGGGGDGFDAIAVTPPADDIVIEGDLTVKGGAGGIAVRAASGRKNVRGAMFVVTPGGRATLHTTDDTGAEALLSAPIDPAPATPVHVKIIVQGTKVEATIGASTLRGTLPATLAKGDVAVLAERGATVEVGAFVLKKK